MCEALASATFKYREIICFKFHPKYEQIIFMSLNLDRCKCVTLSLFQDPL